jgi:transcriptional regulator of arginine metabolism
MKTRVLANIYFNWLRPGDEQPVAAALDEKDWPEAIGTIAGDDTILIVCRDKKAAQKLAKRFEGMIA